jgi:hypothetical protein
MRALEVLVPVSALAVVALTIWAFIASRPECTRTERQYVHHAPRVQYIHTIIPIFHGATEGWEDVCVEWK